MATVIDFASRRPLVPTSVGRELAQIARETARATERVKVLVADSRVLISQLVEMLRVTPGTTAASPNEGTLAMGVPLADNEPIWRPEPRPLRAEARDRLFQDWHTRHSLWAAAKCARDLATHIAWAKHHSNERNLLDPDPARLAARDRYLQATWVLMRTAAHTYPALRWKEQHASELGRAQEIEAILSADRAWLEVRSGANRRARLAPRRIRVE